ncbi:MAG: tetratricopeptide repeat protein [Proteobacteria bacterium]|nr:tetratricopeptide repeat protein [Pseudomonadota bacterium]
MENWPNSPLAPHALFGMGWSYLSQQKYEPADEAFTQLLNDHAAHALAPKAYYARAMTRQPRGQTGHMTPSVALKVKRSDS